MKKGLIIKVVAFCSVFAVGIGCVSFTGDTSYATQTKYELQNQISDINKKQEELEEKLEQLESDASKQEEYQKELSAQMDLSQEKIDTLQAKIDIVDEQIYENEAEIAKKEKEIADTTELFKKRLRTMYMTGNDSTLSIILGSSDFYEMVTSVDMVKRITEYDKGLVTSMVEQINAIEKEKKELEENKAELDASRKEIADEVAVLSASYEKSAAILSDIEKEQTRTEEEAKKLEDAEISYQKELDDLIEQEKAAAAAAASSGYSSEILSGAYNPYGNNFDTTGLLDGYVGGSFMWPVQRSGCYISSYYGTRYYFGYAEAHPAIDITGGGIYGAPIVASNSGYIKRSQWNGGYGYNVMIDHGGGYFTVYAHCSALACSVGQWVEKGEIIAYVGSTGNSTGPHLHFELIDTYQRVNPLNYVSIP